MTSDKTDPFEKFLQQAFSEGVAEPEYAADAAGPEAVPEELKAAIIASAKQESSRLLVDRIAEAVSRSGASLADLAEEAIGEVEEAQEFLAAGADPRVLSPAGHARLLKGAGLDVSAWKGLLTQAVASYVGFRRPTETDVVWGRTTGLSGDERADALTGAEEIRDPERAKRTADQFVEEVVDEWTNVT